MNQSSQIGLPWNFGKLNHWVSHTYLPFILSVYCLSVSLNILRSDFSYNDWWKISIIQIYTYRDTLVLKWYTLRIKYNWLFVKCYLTDDIDAILDLYVVYHSSAGLSIVPQSNSPDVFSMIVQKYATKNDKNVALYDYHFVLFIFK